MSTFTSSLTFHKSKTTSINSSFFTLQALKPQTSPEKKTFLDLELGFWNFSLDFSGVFWTDFDLWEGTLIIRLALLFPENNDEVSNRVVMPLVCLITFCFKLLSKEFDRNLFSGDISLAISTTLWITFLRHLPLSASLFCCPSNEYKIWMVSNHNKIIIDAITMSN